MRAGTRRSRASSRTNRGEIESDRLSAARRRASRSSAAPRISRSCSTSSNAIPPPQLSPDERVNAEIFRTVLENALIESALPHLGDAVQQRQLVLDLSRLVAAVRRCRRYRRYIARMRDIPRYFDEQIVNMRAGLARGFSVPRATLDGRDAVDRGLHRRRSGKEQLLQAVRDDCRRTFPRRAAGAARRRRARRSSSRSCRPIEQAAGLHPRRIYARTRERRSRSQALPDGDAFYRGAGARIHDAPT